jgi:uncharacterized protein YjbJ (UPF0337 family)
VIGKAKQVVGKVKQGAGQMTGNNRLANSGVADQVKGAAQQTWGNVKDAAHEAGKTRQQEKQHKADKMRDNVTTSVEDAKNSANDRIADFKDRQRQRRSA